MNAIQSFVSDFERLKVRLAGDDPLPEVMDELLSSLRRVDPRLYFHLGSHDAGKDLILSAEGHAELMPVLQDLAARFNASNAWGVVLSYDGMLLFGRRNEAVFPKTENGDVLYRMAEGGDSLWIGRDVHFSFVFPTEKDAAAFATELRRGRIHGTVSKYDGAVGFSFQVEMKIFLVPSHDNVTTIEARYGELAAKFHGRNDGWGCFSA